MVLVSREHDRYQSDPRVSRYSCYRRLYLFDPSRIQMNLCFSDLDGPSTDLFLNYMARPDSQ